MRFLRHAAAVLLLPFVVVVIVPRWLLVARAATDTRWGDDWWAIAARVAGALAFAAGFALFAWCVALFARVGEGTLAPWDPTQRLVAAGPYRFVRNPMISGVAAMLIGEALMWGSRKVAIWAATFLVINHLYFILSEEPGLTRRFGADYTRYRDAVPRWLPRTRRRQAD